MCVTAFPPGSLLGYTGNSSTSRCAWNALQTELHYNKHSKKKKKRAETEQAVRSFPGTATGARLLTSTTGVDAPTFAQRTFGLSSPLP
jgi:hypothetical protein